MFITQIQLTSYWYWILKLCLTYLLDLIVFYWDEINIRLIIVKCTIQWYLGHSHCYAATTPSSSKILSLTTNKVLCPQHLWQPPVSLPFLWIYLFWIFFWYFCDKRGLWAIYFAIFPGITPLRVLEIWIVIIFQISSCHMQKKNNKRFLLLPFQSG